MIKNTFRARVKNGKLVLVEAFRRYFELRYGEVKPTAAELRALERGRVAMKHGDYLTLDKLNNAVQPPRRKRESQESVSVFRPKVGASFLLR